MAETRHSLLASAVFEGLRQPFKNVLANEGFGV